MLGALFAIARPSVRLSVRHTGGSVKTVEVRIVQAFPSSFYGVSFIQKF